MKEKSKRYLPLLVKSFDFENIVKFYTRLPCCGVLSGFHKILRFSLWASGIVGDCKLFGSSFLGGEFLKKK